MRCIVVRDWCIYPGAIFVACWESVAAYLEQFGDKCEPPDRSETVDVLDGRRGRVWGGGRGVVLYLKHLLFTYNQRENHLELDYIT